MSESATIKRLEAEIKSLEGQCDLLRSYQNQNDQPTDQLQNNFTILEVVAIPANFDISSFLSLREQHGMSRYDGLDLEQVKFLAESAKNSPILALFDNKLRSGSVLYLLSILEELNLVVKSIHNPIRKTYQQYENFLDYNLRMAPEDRYSLNIILINIFLFVGDEIIKESLEIAMNLQKYQVELNKSLGKIPDLDLMS